MAEHVVFDNDSECHPEAALVTDFAEEMPWQWLNDFHSGRPTSPAYDLEII